MPAKVWVPTSPRRWEDQRRVGQRLAQRKPSRVGAAIQCYDDLLSQVLEGCSIADAYSVYPRALCPSSPTAALTRLSPENTAHSACPELALCFLVDCLYVLSPRMAGTQARLSPKLPRGWKREVGSGGGGGGGVNAA